MAVRLSIAHPQLNGVPVFQAEVRPLYRSVYNMSNWRFDLSQAKRGII
jgi:hypothetical protein